MSHINSDVDYFVCFAYDTREILRNLRALQKSFFVHTAREDTHYHEIGKVVEQLLKGNLNYILGVMSPVIVITSRYHKKLKKLLERYLPRNAYHSIRGFAINNYERALKEESPPTEHRLNKILRVLEFGITLFKTGVYEFRGGERRNARSYKNKDERTGCSIQKKHAERENTGGCYQGSAFRNKT